MTPESQLAGLDRFLAMAYDGSTTLDSLLGSLGFDTSQRAFLLRDRLPAITQGLLEAIRQRLTWEDKDLWFRLVSLRLGLEGNTPASIEAAARMLDIVPAYASYAEGEALQRCRTKAALEEFKRELRRIGLEQLRNSGQKPARENVLGKLERLADLRAAADLARVDYEARRLEVMKKVQDELDAIEAEFGPTLEAAEANTRALEAEVKNDVLLRGESLRGSAYRAIYMKGRVSWDAAAMNEYARDHPEVLPFRKEGQPSVTLRRTG